MKRVSVAVVGLMAVALATSPAAVAAPSWTMPNLIGMDLQGAQDAIQSLTHGEVWFSSSTDLTGRAGPRSATAIGRCAARRRRPGRRSVRRPRSTSGWCASTRRSARDGVTFGARSRRFEPQKSLRGR